MGHSCSVAVMAAKGSANVAREEKMRIIPITSLKYRSFIDDYENNIDDGNNQFFCGRYDKNGCLKKNFRF